MLKRYRVLLLVVLLLVAGTMVNAHPIKMTTGKLEINSETKSCELTLNFFTDDFESALQDEYPQPAFNYKDPQPEMLETIRNYVLRQLSLRIDEVEVRFTMQKVEKIEDNVCQVTFTGDLKAINEFETATIKNTLLFTAFDKQSNILHLVFNGKKVAILQFYPATPVRKERLK